MTRARLADVCNWARRQKGGRWRGCGGANLDACPNFLQSASCHAVDGALSKTVEQDTVVELRQPRARSDVAHGDVSRIAAANAVHVSCSNALARV